MKKWLAISILMLILVLFNLIMVSGGYLKQSFGENDDVSAIVNEIKDDINRGDWACAKEGALRLETAWEIVTKRVQFSTERDELVDGKTSVESAKGYIDAEDKGGAFAELNEVKEHWSEIGE